MTTARTAADCAERTGTARRLRPAPESNANWNPATAAGQPKSGGQRPTRNPLSGTTGNAVRRERVPPGGGACRQDDRDRDKNAGQQQEPAAEAVQSNATPCAG